MNLLMTIFFCFLASIGVVQCASWLMSRRRRPRGLRWGYHIIPLYDEPAFVEEQLRYCISCLSWGRDGCGTALLVDMGLGEESAAICRRFVWENPGLVFCAATELPAALRELDKTANCQ